MMKYRFVWYWILIAFPLLFTLHGQDDLNKAVSDSILEQYSVEELLEFKKYYQGELNELEKQKTQISEIAISDGEAFIRKHPDSKIIDKIYMRLGELYFEKANEDYLAAQQNYDNQLKKYEDGLITQEPVEPKKDFSKSLEMYERILKEFPQSDLVDDAIYNKGFLISEMGQPEEGLKVYQYLMDEFSDSRYVPECLMRIAEYYFNPPVNNIEKAIEIYKEVLNHRDSPRYDEALYRLGWSYYRLNMYPEAVSFFTLLADDLERTKQLDPNQKYSNPALQEESVEYIGISFLDYGGVEGAAAYLKDIGGRKYGFKILQKIGDTFMQEKEEYEQAINAYQTLLDMFPLAPDAPSIQLKIVQCHQKMENDMDAYLARKTLFNNFGPASDWWKQNDSIKVRQKALSLSEQALRENITLLYQRADDLKDLDLYQQAVNDSREYLKAIPKDSNSALIHWNMALTLDLKLKRYGEAYQEYMHVTDLYWDTKYQRFAAENAIALAKEEATNTDSLAQLQREQSKEMAGDEKEVKDEADLKAALKHDVVELKETDKKLAAAYDNFIMLYPHDPKTAVILANAGALHYNHNQFQKALRYFNTLVRHFPDGPDVDYAQFTIMECYFGKQDFKSSEIVAQKLKSSTKFPAITQKATRRLAESIFLQAEALADSGLHLKAGNEFVRVVVEVPDIIFADLALFNGALQYDAAHEFRRAVESYDYLIQTFINSKYRLDAMNNMALDYGELKEYRNAAISYEKLAAIHPERKRASDALYNSSVFYVRSEDWKSAIRVNTDYVSRFPESDDAADLYFEIANHHLKLNNLNEANKIYGEYTTKFPNSVRVVESHFKRGEYYRDNDQADLARIEFEKAIQKSEELKANGLNPNNYFTAEALFALTNLKFYEYERIEFSGTAPQIEEAKKFKKALLLDLVDNYAKVARFGTLRLYEATYQIGRTYEEFGATWARQQLPEMEEAKRVVANKEINEAAAQLYERAVESYANGVQALTRIADDFEAAIKAKRQAETTDSTRNNPNQYGRVTIEDSTLYIARKWIEHSREKVSEVIYDIAELNQESVTRFLQAAVPAELDEVAALEYRNQVLDKAVRPLINEIVVTHTRNVNVAQQMILENQWVTQSKQKLFATGNILPHEYKQLAFDALATYSRKSEQYLDSIKNGNKAPQIVTQMATVIDYANAFSRGTLKFYQNTIENARSQAVEDNFVQNTEIEMMKTAYQLSMALDSLANYANRQHVLCKNSFKETEQPACEEALYAFEDNFYSFREAKKSLLETGYNLSNEMGIANIWTNNVLFELVKSAPDKYQGLMDLKSTNEVLMSDGSWITTDQYSPEWIGIDFDDSKWLPAQVQQEGVLAGSVTTNQIWCMKIDTLVVEKKREKAASTINWSDSTLSDSARWAYRRAQVFGDSTVAENTKPEYVYEFKTRSVTRAFFRKTFEINGLPVSGEIVVGQENTYNLFLNGEYIAASDGVASNGNNINKHRLNEHLRMGRNVLAIEVKTENPAGSGLKAQITLSLLPGWDQKQKQFKFRMMDAKAKQNLIFNKNVMIY
ncbi:tetratricopeptide repeat protein [candidate division KSB1 bacterium]|nr:tetratricopeptide repeat protein [candidate division KSB1 bacterium]